MRGDCLSMFLDPWRRTFEFFLHIPFPTLILMCARFFALALHVHEPLTTTWRIRGFPATPQLGWKMSVLRRMHTDALKISKDSNFYELLYDYIYIYVYYKPKNIKRPCDVGLARLMHFTWLWIAAYFGRCLRHFVKLFRQHMTNTLSPFPQSLFGIS